MKKVKTLSLSLVVMFAGIFVYANLRPLSVAEKMKPVHLATFRLEGKMSDGEWSSLEQTVHDMHGVTACTINEKSHVASVLYYPDKTNEAALAGVLAARNRKIEKRTLQTSGGCPVHGITASVQAFMARLDLRH